MKTLQEHEKEFMENTKVPDNWRNTGISCDRCGNELEENAEVILTSYPPQKAVRCSQCGFTGYMH